MAWQEKELRQDVIDMIKILAVGESVEIRGISTRAVLAAEEFIAQHHNREHLTQGRINSIIIKRTK